MLWWQHISCFRSPRGQGGTLGVWPSLTRLPSPWSSTFSDEQLCMQWLLSPKQFFELTLCTPSWGVVLQCPLRHSVPKHVVGKQCSNVSTISEPSAGRRVFALKKVQFSSVGTSSKSPDSQVTVPQGPSLRESASCQKQRATNDLVSKLSLCGMGVCVGAWSRIYDPQGQNCKFTLAIPCRTWVRLALSCTWSSETYVPGRCFLGKRSFPI